MKTDRPKEDRPRRPPIPRFLRDVYFVHVLYEDRLFAAIVAGALVIVAAVGISLPKIWRTTPENFERGVVKVSVIDKIQAWSLARSARREAAAGRTDAALLAWRGAVANNLGDPELHRGLLRFLRTVPVIQSENTPLALTSASWLIALGRTNATDAALAAEVLERQGRPAVGLTWIDDDLAERDEPLARVRSRCLLASGRWDQFGRLWDRWESQWRNDPGQRVQYDAWLAGSDDHSAGLEALVRLKETAARPGEEGLTAARLLLLVALRTDGIETMIEAVKRLDERGSASAVHHAALWKMLAAHDRAEEARQLATSGDHPLPRDPSMAARQLMALHEIGLRDEALRRLDRNIEAFGSHSEVWRVYFELLIEAGNWTELSRVTANARLLAAPQETLFAEVAFADYLAACGQGRQADQGRMARQLAGLQGLSDEQLTRIVRRLRQDGRSDTALELLRSYRDLLRNWAPYWTDVFECGRALKDLEVMRQAVDELLRIDPASPTWTSNRAALLLITGENPAEALQLTLQGLNRQPRSTTLRINHAIALLFNGRVAEAERLLETVPAARLAPDAADSYYLASAEIQAAKGRTDAAAEFASRVDRSRLMPSQIERLDRVVRAKPAGDVK